MVRQFGIRAWDSVFAVSRCTQCGFEGPGSIGSAIGIEFGPLARFENQLVKWLNVETAACKKCQGKTTPVGLLYCSYYPEIRADLHVLVWQTSEKRYTEFSKVNADGTSVSLGHISNDEEFTRKFGIPFSLRGEWGRIVLEAVKSNSPRFLMVQDGYLISCSPRPNSAEEKESINRRINEFAQEHMLNFWDSLSNAPARKVDPKESFEAWLEDSATRIREGDFVAYGLVSTEAFVQNVRKEFPGYQLEFPKGFDVLNAPMFRCRKGDFYLEDSMASYLMTAIQRGLSLQRTIRDVLVPGLIDRIDLMEELVLRLKPIFQSYNLSIDGGRILKLIDKSSGELAKSWDLYQFADEFAGPGGAFEKFVMDKLGYDIQSKQFLS